MTIEKLREAHKAQPFVPFTIHLSDGRSFDVPHPEWLWLTPGGRVAWVAHGPRGTRSDMVDLLHVTSLELKPPSSSAA
jgi:hypothetical protein